MLNTTKSKKQEVKSRFLSGKKQLPKRLSAFIVTAVMFYASANAQIVYTNVNPDSTSSGTYNLDLNNDGINDFTIRKVNSFHVYVHCTPCNRTTYATPTTISIQPLGSNAIGLDGGNSKLNSNTLINSTGLAWSDTFSVILSKTTYSTTGTCLNGYPVCIPHATQSGNWFGASDKYLGLRINVGTAIYYGWVRLTVSGSSSFTVKDYAYDSTPGHSIRAGVTSGARIENNSINESLLNTFSLFPNPATNSVTIKFPPDSDRDDKAGHISIINLFGQIIYSEKIVPIAIGTKQIQIDVSKFSAGMYVVRWISGEEYETKNFSVIK